MAKYDYLIVGSGFSGAVFAYEASKRGKTCLVLERRGHVGGNAYCEQIEGINVHKYGPHIFHTSNKKVWDFVNTFAEFNNYINSPLANYRGELYNLPFNMNTFAKLWGVATPAQALAVIEDQRGEYKGTPKNLKEQALALIGRDIFEKLIQGYTEKQWGHACEELPADIIKRIPVRLTFNNNYFNDRYQGVPVGGYNSIFEKLLQNCEVVLNTDYHSDRDGFNRLAKKVVYTGMIDAFFDHNLGYLEYRSLRFETEVLNEENHQGVAVMNYTDKETPYTRVIEHKHFEFGEQPNTVVTKEYPISWEPGVEAYYPVNDEKNQYCYKKYSRQALDYKTVVFCGRLAEYKYYDMDDAISAAFDVTEKELGA